MRVKAAIVIASALFAVGGGCSRPWQASTGDLAPLNPPPYGQTRYPNDPSPQYPAGEQASSSSPVSEPQPPSALPGARRVRTITIPTPGADQ